MKVQQRSVDSPVHDAHRRHGWQLPLATVTLLFLAMSSIGCDDDDDGFVDVTPPAIPAGVSSITADEEVILFWIPNREFDLAGYRIWWSEDNYDFGSEPLDDIDAWDPLFYDGGSGEGDDYMVYSDFGIPNGSENFYAVTAYDLAGNESDLSLEYVRDVPRPEGDVVLQERDSAPLMSGFDFSDAVFDPSPQDWQLASSDFSFDVDGNGVPWLMLQTNTVNREIRVQDTGYYGPPNGFDGLSFAPASGYSSLEGVEAIAGHVYVFEIVTGPGTLDALNYAKLYVKTVGPTQISLRWGYQEVIGEPQLKNLGKAPGSPQIRALEWTKRKAEQS